MFNITFKSKILLTFITVHLPIILTLKIKRSFSLLTVLCLLLFNTIYFKANAQCPPNIDFEYGDFSGWTCYIGYGTVVNGQNELNLTDAGGPVLNRHTMYSANSGLVDQYGGFSVNCPNGSGHSIRLGNDEAGGQAEGISYEFTIPADKPVFSLIYHYAVVFQDPNHQIFEQPRMVTEITNLTDNSLINCSSFTFIPFGSILPGFFESPNAPDNTPVWCKGWSAVSINLDGLAGKTIRLFFKTSDCTFRRHFGYAYIDVNSECSSEFTGASYCRDDTAVYVTAPYGYQNYTWYNNTFTQVLGNQQTIYLNPPPPPGTNLAVELIPYSGYGCLDTLYANMIDTLKLKANAGPDALYCNGNIIRIGTPPMPNVNYSWSPPIGLSDPSIANPIANPQFTTTYELTIRSRGGGCVSKDEVVVVSSNIDSSLQLLGKTEFCTTSADSAVLIVKPTNNIQWFKNGGPISGASQLRYKVTQSGKYYALLTNVDGCSIKTRTVDILIESPRPGITYPVKYTLADYPLTLQARTFGNSVLWKPSNYLTNPNIYNPEFKSPEELVQLYNIEITTSAGCLTVDNQLIRVIKEVKVFVPTAFTPNNNGLNDYLKPTLLGIKELRYFRVYHRYGQLVYDYTTNKNGWDGKVNGILQSSGVYVWTFQAIGLDNKIYNQKGTVALIR